MSRKLVLSFALVAAGCGSDGGKTPPPFGVPITGGTILVTRDGGHVIVSDPDRDRIMAVELATMTVVSEIALTPGDEPGRVIEDVAGRIHVALRRGGSVVTLASATATEVAERRFACSEPRGLAFEAATSAIHVACAGGELVSFPAAGGGAIRTLRLDRDLRDVIVSGSQLVVTRFRSAELLTLDATGAIVSRATPPPVFRFGGFGGGVPDAEPGMSNAPATVAWRTIALADGRLVMSHQRQIDRELGSKEEGGYGGNCDDGPVETALSIMTPGQPPIALGAMSRGALPVDLAVSPAGDKIALVVAGNSSVKVEPTSFVVTRQDQEECGPRPDDKPNDDGDQDAELGAPTSTAFTPSGDLVVFYPERPALVVRAGAGLTKRFVLLPGAQSHDAGRQVFHAQTRLALACASCHPEGREDGRVWNFAAFGPRRTQSLAGNLLERAPFHWTGDMSTLDTLMDDVFAIRMGGGQIPQSQKSALGAWLDRIPAPPSLATADAATLARGKAIFENDAQCATCHNGDLISNKLLVDVGTGGAFKVPSLLGIASRPPFMHDGCAQTLTERFGASCGGGNLHGRTEQLTTAQIADLVAYLESL